MRCWTTGQGTLLVEIEAMHGAVDYGPLYREFDVQGALVQTYRPYAYSVQEILGTYRYRVERGSLVESWTEESDRGGPRTVERPVVNGLTPTDSGAFTFLEQSLSRAITVEQAEAFHRRAVAESRQALRLRSVSDLPDVQGDEPLDIVLAEDGAEAVVTAGDRVLWSEPRMDWPHNHAWHLQKIIRAKYGARLRTFRDLIGDD